MPCHQARLATPAGAADLMSHTAHYRFTLGDRTPGTPVSNVRGSAEYRFERVCDGYIQSSRSVLSLLTETAGAIDIATRETTWEARDGSEFRFRIREAGNDRPAVESIGHARTGPAAEARFDAPKRKVMALPGDTVFPTAHIARLIRAARAGERFLVLPVFAGTADVALSRVSATIDPTPRRVETALPEIGDMRFWRMNLATYGDDAAQSGMPDYEMTLHLAETGVTHRFEITYGDAVVVIGTLAGFEPLDEPDC